MYENEDTFNQRTFGAGEDNSDYKPEETEFFGRGLDGTQSKMPHHQQRPSDPSAMATLAEAEEVKFNETTLTAM